MAATSAAWTACSFFMLAVSRQLPADPHPATVKLLRQPGDRRCGNRLEDLAPHEADHECDGHLAQQRERHFATSQPMPNATTRAIDAAASSWSCVFACESLSWTVAVPLTATLGVPLIATLGVPLIATVEVPVPSIVM